MKSLARRAFLRMLPAAGLAGKVVAEQAAAKLARVDVAGIGNKRLDVPGQFANPDIGPTQAEIASRALRVPALRAELTSLLYEEHRYISAIDPDLAAKRSFSLAAKIAFQRQRNVARALECDLVGNHPYYRKGKLFSRLAREFFGDRT